MSGSYLEIDLQVITLVTGFRTQGRNDEWCDSYRIHYYDEDATAWYTYEETDGVEKVSGMVKHHLLW